MKLKWMIMVLLLQSIFTIVMCGRMVFNASLSLNLERETNLHKSHVIFTIQSEDGDIIECIDIYKQPSLDHPSLKNHKIQMHPSYKVDSETKEIEGSSQGYKPMKLASQRWQRSGSCPMGTIPVRRIDDKNDVVSRKVTSSFDYNRQLNDTKVLYLLQKNHSLGIIHTEGYAYYGAKGDIKVWNPHVDLDDDYSTSRVALKSGPISNYEAMEAGWVVNPKVYGDRQTRLYVYWTKDSSQKTGCFDLTCPGFIQTSNEIALGAAIYPISNPTGLPYQITILIHKDLNTSNWWVQYNEETYIGYWPYDLFKIVSHHAETVQWGGEVYSTRVGTTPHTATEMGSGRLPDFIMQTSGFVKRMRVMENNLVLRFPQWTNSYTDEYNCYQTYFMHDFVDEPEFYYGGPGKSPICP